jgi:Right handed beta helix region
MLNTKVAGALALLFAALYAAPAHADILTVDNTGDSGAGSLRDAIDEANSDVDQDIIKFDIPAGPYVITPATNLPRIEEPVKINGYSQAGTAGADADTPAVLLIEIDGQNSTVAALRLRADDSEIKGLVINNTPGLNGDAIRIDGDRNVVRGNHLGTNAAGDAPVPNSGDGVHINGDENVVGGTGEHDRNVVSANEQAGVYVKEGSDNLIHANLIGTDATGTVIDSDGDDVEDLGNFRGVDVESPSNHVGGGNPGEGNVIAGNFTGVELTSNSNFIRGNKIGTNVGGDAALGNGTGVEIEAGSQNWIGGFTPGHGNVISGNDSEAVHVTPLTDVTASNHIEGNLIGTDATGTAPLPNDGLELGVGAINISESDNNNIGSTDPDAANVIAGNNSDGVEIDDDAAGNVVRGNKIGVDAAGDELGNDGSGVMIDEGDDNTVDGANTIAHNADDGVTVEDGDGNTIVENSIFGNGGLGIDLNRDDVTDNDVGVQDADTGANGLQNFPDLTSADETAVDWTLDTAPTAPLQNYRLDFYACDADGEGEVFLGTQVTPTDAGGLAAGQFVPPSPLTAGQLVTATATFNQLVFNPGPIDPLDPHLLRTDPRQTSEFSPCEEVTS